MALRTFVVAVGVNVLVSRVVEPLEVIEVAKVERVGVFILLKTQATRASGSAAVAGGGHER